MSYGAYSAYATSDMMEHIPFMPDHHCFEKSRCFNDLPFNLFQFAVFGVDHDITMSLYASYMMYIYV